MSDFEGIIALIIEDDSISVNVLQRLLNQQGAASVVTGKLTTQMPWSSCAPMSSASRSRDGELPTRRAWIPRPTSPYAPTVLSRYSHVRMEAKRRALDEIAARQNAADEKRNVTEQTVQAAVISELALVQ